MKTTPRAFARFATVFHGLPANCRSLFALALILWMPIAGHAQTGATGSIQGRVLNATNGLYMDSVVVSIEGTSLQTITDNFGDYKIENVPVGPHTVRVTYTGKDPQTASVVVSAGNPATQDFKLGDEQSGAKLQPDGSVMLDQFVVAADRYKNAREIAINEERTAVNIKNVISADAFGDIPSGNIGEFVKFLPGVQISYGSFGGNNQGYSANAASGISVRGFGPEDTAILIDGMPVSNATPGSLSRQVGLDMLSINNASRVELIKVATPDMPSNSAGGQVNLITKSAFEYSHPSYSARVFFNFNSINSSLDKTVGPTNKKTYKTTPGTEFSVSYPVSKRIGFSVSGYAARQFDQSYRAQPILTTSTAATITNASGVATLSNPILSRLQLTETPRLTDQTSANLRLDWKPGPGQVLSTNFQLSTYDGIEAARRLDYRPTIAAGADWGPTFTTGTTANSTLDMTVTTRDKVGLTKSGQLQYRYQLGGWKIYAGGSVSVSSGDYKDRANGHYSEIGLKLNPGQIAFSNIANGIPGTVTTYKRVANGGTQTDYTNLSNWGFDQTIAKSGEASSKNTVGLYKVDVERALNFIPRLDSHALMLKVGARRDQETTDKSGLGTGYSEDLIAGKSYLIADIFDDTYTGRTIGFGQPAQQWGSSYKLFALNKQNQLFAAPADGTTAVNNYTSYVNQQKHLTETTDGFYAMLSGKFISNRLSVVGGARQEQKSRVGRGPFTDGKWQYAKKANGTLYIDPFYKNGVTYDGTSVVRTNADGTTTAVTNFLGDASLLSRLTAAGIKYPDHLYGLPASSLEAKKLQLIANRQINEKITGDPSYSLNTAFDLTPNLVLKAAVSRSFSLPSLEDGTAGLLSGNGAFSINENTSVAADGTKGTIAVANPGLLPSTSNNIDLQIAYYTRQGGKFAVSYYTKSVSNQSQTFTTYSSDPLFSSVLDALGLDPAAYQDWKLTTSSNSSTKQKTHGYEFEVNQDLGILGRWGRPFALFATYSMKSLGTPSAPTPVTITTPSGATVTLTPTVKTITLSANRFASAGLQFSSKRVSVQVRGTYRNDNEPSGTRTPLSNGNFLRRFEPAEKRVDVNTDYRFKEHYSIFVSGRDVLNGSRKLIIRDDQNLLPAYAQTFDNNRFGITWTAGVRGTF